MQAATVTAIDHHERQRLLERADGIHRFPAKMAIRLARIFFDEILDDVTFASFYDPFCGSGTTALVARSYGCSVAGGEIHPANAMVAKAKLTRLTEHEFEVLQSWLSRRIVTGRRKPQTDSQFWTTWWTPPTYAALEQIRDEIRHQAPNNMQPHLLTALSQASWDVSGADPDVMVPTHSKHSPTNPNLFSVDVRERFRIRLQRILRAQCALQKLDIAPGRTNISTANATVQKDWPSEVNLILTSPPYGIGVDYVRAASLQGRLLFGDDTLQEVRHTTLGRVNSFEVDQDLIPAKYRRQVWYKAMGKYGEGRLASFARYIGEMRDFLKCAHGSLSANGHLGLVLGDPETQKKTIPLTAMMHDIAIEEGFKLSRDPKEDAIVRRFQTGQRRSSRRPISKETLLPLVPI